MNKTSLIIINSHPIQYYTPLYKKINKDLNVDLEVWFCSNMGVENYFDKEFNINLKWDIPLLDGFAYTFLKNFSILKNKNFPIFGLINLNIIPKLFLKRKSIIWVDSWSQLSFILAIIFVKLFGHRIFFRSETPLSHEILKSNFYLKFRHVIFKFLFSFIDKFLYIGEQNRKFYKYYNVDDSKLVFMPYCVDNNYFSELNQIQALNYSNKYGIEKGHQIIMFCGKFISKKNPLDIIKAFEKIKIYNSKLSLILVGTGPLELELKNYINNHKLQDVHITGFINQTEIKYFYNLADVFVMSSGVGETWGLATNEALNFHSSIVVSHLTGCTIDLVTEGINGFTFITGDIDDLSNSIKGALLLDKSIIIEENRKKIKIFSYNTCINSLSKLLG